jgi:hypothetical protein
MPENEFKYYALHYLNLWVSQDKPWCKALAGTDDSDKLGALRKAAGFYSIARNLPKKFDTGNRLGPVLEIIDAQSPADFQDPKLLRSIEKVRKNISARYGGRDVLSATTKFLWLKMQSPIIIYDSQARKALSKLGSVKHRIARIDEYYDRWRKEFKPREQEIRDACASLQNIYEYAENPEAALDECRGKTIEQSWFRERVFDVYLWRRGLDA